MLCSRLKAADAGIKTETHLRLGDVFVEVLVLESVTLRGRYGLLNDTEPHNGARDCF
jgi:hypothetical protein